MAQRLTLVIVFLLFPCFAHGQAEGTSFDFGNINFSLSPKIMEDGSITDISLGFMYNERLGGDFRYSNTIISRNEEFSGLHDSLNARDERIYEWYILPIGYRHKSGNAAFWAGGGVYYEYNKLNEKGFFDDPDLEAAGFERVNSYTNDFSMNVFGPLVDVKVSYAPEFFSITAMGGIVPVFSLSAKEKFGIVPFLGSKKEEHSQNTWGSPYFYLSLDAVIYKYVNLCVNYHYSRIKYETIDYNVDHNNNVTWEYPETTVVGNSFEIEVSALIPLGNDLRFQIGYGYCVNALTIDSRKIDDNKHYLILGTKKFAAKK